MIPFVALAIIVGAMLTFAIRRLTDRVDDLQSKLLAAEDALKAARREIAQLQPKRDARGHFVKTNAP